MSGAAEGIGLALSAISVATLFTTCIECFDIVIAVKNFSEDYEQLCALFSLQRARFGLWGESVGLIPNPADGCQLQYNKNLDRPDIRPGIERTLNNIKSLLDEAGRVDERYGLKADNAPGLEALTSRGIDIFKSSFDRFKYRIRRHQKKMSAWNVTRWAVHDADKFEGMINRLEKFVDGLESLTKSLGLLQEQHARLREEIESISDVESLRLLRDASSSHNSSPRYISDAASQRLITVRKPAAEQKTLSASSSCLESSYSFVTAGTRPSEATDSLLSVDPRIPGSWPQSVKSESEKQRRRAPPLKIRLKGISKPSPSCEECFEEHYKCGPGTDGKACTRCVEKERKCSFLHEYEELATTNRPEEEIVETLSLTKSETCVPPEGLPQNQRLLSKLIERAEPRKPLSFAAGDAHYGDQLATIKKVDEEYWLNHSPRILSHANSGSSAAKRMFIELRNIRAGKVPFISAVPIDESLDKVLASIEGPPDTPYEGGVFWITIKLSTINSFSPPLMRFQTKIYHPNISPQGHICADYGEKWTSYLPARTYKSPVKNPDSLWYRTKSTDIQWSLGALLTAICGLLATPDVDDPLVPEIAQKYVEDYSEYCKNARLYTKRYATSHRPEDRDLQFLEESPAGGGTNPSIPLFTSHTECEADVVNEISSLRSEYDDKAPWPRKNAKEVPSLDENNEEAIEKYEKKSRFDEFEGSAQWWDDWSARAIDELTKLAPTSKGSDKQWSAQSSNGSDEEDILTWI